jgi:hypothetical protein
MKISLNIFTNSTLSAPRTDIIRRTYDSFCDTFGNKYNFAVYCDSHPNFKMFKFYFETLQKIFPKVYKTNSLSDGYIKSIENAESDYLFQLEGDWQFNKPLIKHSLEDICHAMELLNIYHLRFNKRQNIISGWDIGLKEISIHGFTCCETSCLSNNPHIIDVKKYREKCLPLLQIKPGSKGIEENLTHVGLTGCIYGGRDYPACVRHIDGRRSR